MSNTTLYKPYGYTHLLMRLACCCDHIDLPPVKMRLRQTPLASLGVVGGRAALYAVRCRKAVVLSASVLQLHIISVYPIHAALTLSCFLCTAIAAVVFCRRSSRHLRRLVCVWTPCKAMRSYGNISVQRLGN